MGFLKNFFTNVFHEETVAPVRPASSFEQLTSEELEVHLGINRYGDFVLSDAIRPSYDLEIIPSAGFRHDAYRDEESKRDVPVLMAAQSKERLFETFMALLAPLGSTVDVVLESSHNDNPNGQPDLYREQIDMPILQSILWDFEDLLTNDGCTGIAVLNPRAPQEVQLDEHKLLIIYGEKLTPYESIMIDQYVPCRKDIKFITEAEHVHSTTDRYVEQFTELTMRLGMDDYNYS